ncbi:unnamed protein product [Mycena citricolor]|uniref:Glutamine amidotransferase type-2 domain-containing protein n=1 Tax=Mycena citricolor TaxID=2018698 RepID=A0AAD2K7M2_9AGAR|nr:unnamed protein product [Mycena citricolor]
MCGLSAVAYYGSASPPRDLCAQIEASLTNIHHRGPDSQGIYLSEDGRVGLGHARLSIIDLATGQQPLSDETGGIQCVVTGELYDYARIRAELEANGAVFKTHSDSELVVHLYQQNGFNLLHSLRGEFAFVLYDATRKLVFAARDRLGIKPLYYTVSDERLLIASEMKAFLPLGWKAEWDIHSIVHSGDVSDDRTVFKGGRKLNAGMSLLYRPASGYLKVQPYWDLDYTPSAVPQTIDEMVDGVRERLVRAVELRLRSDVPVGVYLSGGIDSSAVAGIVTELLRKDDPNARIATFTLAFPDAKDNDEGPIAARTAEHLGAESHMVNVDEAALVEALEATIWHTEQVNFTFQGPGKFLLSKYVNEQGYKVVLTGEGADEFFGGYPWFPIDYLRPKRDADLGDGEDVVDRCEARQGDARGISCHRAYASAGTAASELFDTRALAMTGEPDITLSIAEHIDARVREKAVSGEWHALHVCSYVTAKTILQNSILNQVGERSEMAHSVEGRPPFLDHHLVDYINGLPPSVKVRPIKGGFTDKWLLREAVRPFVPEEVYNRKKLMYNSPAARREAGTRVCVPSKRMSRRGLRRRLSSGSDFSGGPTSRKL